MRITCEYCDTSFDAKDHSVCPNCGATLKNPLERQQQAQTETERRKLELEEKRLEIEKQKVEAQSNQDTLNFISGLIRSFSGFNGLSNIRYRARKGLRAIGKIIIALIVLVILIFLFFVVYPIVKNNSLLFCNMTGLIPVEIYHFL